MTLRLMLATALAASVSTLAMAQTLDTGEVVTLDQWQYESLYTGGWSAEDFLNNDVVSPTGETIGEVEDIIVGASGQILSIVAEIGGFIDIGDTHVSVPWDEVSVENGTVIVPVTEENLEQYDYLAYSGLEGGGLSEEIVRGVDDLEAGFRAWRVSELIGDYARLRDADAYSNYGYVNDVIFRDGEIAATVVDPGVGFGTGNYAYPYYGYGYGWEPGYEYYDLPYADEEVGALEPFDYELIE